MKFMRKRGQLVFNSLVGIILGSIAFVMLPMIGKACATGEICLKAAASKDIALIIDSIYSYPYNIQIEYDYDLKGLIVDISQGSVKIYRKSSVTLEGNEIKEIRRDPTLKKYEFAPINNYVEDLNIVLDQPKTIIFKKEDGKLTIIGTK
jgi:hypothetical protein